MRIIPYMQVKCPLVLSLCLAILLFGCSNKEMEEKIQQLEKEKVQVQAESEEKQRQNWRKFWQRWAKYKKA